MGWSDLVSMGCGWLQVVLDVFKALEHDPLSFASVCYLLLRFHNLRSPAIYGDTVHKMIEKVRDQLSQPTPVRQSWLQLVKDLASFVQCTANLEETEWSGFTGKAPVRFHRFRKSVQNDLQNGSKRDVLKFLVLLAGCPSQEAEASRWPIMFPKTVHTHSFSRNTCCCSTVWCCLNGCEWMGMDPGMV